MFYVKAIQDYYNKNEKNKRNFKIIVASIIVITAIPITITFIGFENTVGGILLTIIFAIIDYISNLLKKK